MINKKMILTPLILMIISGNSDSAVVVAASKPRQQTSFMGSDSTPIRADSFMSCGQDNDSYESQVIPTGEGCLYVYQTEYKAKESDWINTRKETRNLIKYRDMVKDKGEFVGIQIIHKYSSSGGRYPFVYVFYNESKLKVERRYYLLCGTNTSTRITVPKIEGCEVTDVKTGTSKNPVYIKRVVPYKEMVSGRGEFVEVKQEIMKKPDGSLIPVSKIVYKVSE